MEKNITFMVNRNDIIKKWLLKSLEYFESIIKFDEKVFLNICFMKTRYEISLTDSISKQELLSGQRTIISKKDFLHQSHEINCISQGIIDDKRHAYHIQQALIQKAKEERLANTILHIIDDNLWVRELNDPYEFRMVHLRDGMKLELNLYLNLNKSHLAQFLEAGHDLSEFGVSVEHRERNKFACAYSHAHSVRTSEWKPELSEDLKTLYTFSSNFCDSKHNCHYISHATPYKLNGELWVVVDVNYNSKYSWGDKQLFYKLVNGIWKKKNLSSFSPVLEVELYNLMQKINSSSLPLRYCQFCEHLRLLIEIEIVEGRYKCFKCANIDFALELEVYFKRCVQCEKLIHRKRDQAIFAKKFGLTLEKIEAHLDQLNFGSLCCNCYDKIIRS